MPDPLNGRKVVLGLIALGGLAFGTDPNGSTSPFGASIPAPATPGAVNGISPSGSSQRGGWDGNTNEPLLADDFA